MTTNTECGLPLSLVLSFALLPWVTASAQSQVPKVRLETKETFLCKVPFTVNPTTALTSPDERHIAFVVPRGGKRSIALDGVESPRYDAVTNLVFSPDSKHLAYLARRGDDRFIVMDGKDGKHYQGFAPFLQFSPDSQRLACFAVSGTNHVFVLNHEEIRTNEEVYRFNSPRLEAPNLDLLERPVVFSRDSKHFAYCVGVGDKVAVVRDRSKESEYDELRSRPAFSFDSQHLAYSARRGTNYIVVVDGIEGPVYEDVGLVGFSPDGRLAYFAIRARKRFLVLDGREGTPYEEVGTHIAWSADGSRFAYRAGRAGHSFAVIDGKESEELFDDRCVVGFGFGAKGRSVAYTVSRGEDRWILVVDGKMGPVWDGIRMSGYFPCGEETNYNWFSPDGRVIYMGRKSGKFHLIIGEETGKPYDDLGTVAFSADGKHTAVAAAAGKEFFVIVDGVEGKHYPITGVFPGLPNLAFNSADSLHYLVWRVDDAFEISVFRTDMQVLN
jgi:WD40 repeat protein